MKLKLQRIGALLLLALGTVTTRDLMLPATDRLLPVVAGKIALFGPGVALLGLLLLARSFEWGARSLTRRNVLVTGFVLLGAGILVGAVAMATDHGGDASWANAMWFQMAEIFVGLPGLLLTLAALLLKKENSK